MGKIVCNKCGKKYSLNESLWRCECESYLDIEFKAKFFRNELKKRKPAMWRYREAIPVDSDKNIVSFDEGYTPLIKQDMNGKRVLLKLEQLFTTGSFKDRGASVLISKAKEAGIKSVVEDSSGNAGCAVAAYCVKAGINCDIYVPENTSPGKLRQIRAYGANLLEVKGSREDTAKAAQNAAENTFYASHVWNPFFLQGTKTFSYEIWEQLSFSAPDTVITPVGHGSMLIGAFIGFKDLMNAGLIKKLPKFIGVQAEKCAPLYHMYKENNDRIPEIKPEKTIAEGIRISRPVRANQILDIIKETGGRMITVSEEEIKKALLQINKSGLFIEPTSAAGIAGFQKYKPVKKEIIVIPLTGHGLKTAKA